MRTFNMVKKHFETSKKKKKKKRIKNKKQKFTGNILATAFFMHFIFIPT